MAILRPTARRGSGRTARVQGRKRWLQARLRSRSERGSALIVALVVVAVMMLVLGTLVGYANTSQRTVPVYREKRAVRYESDAAVKTAVNWARDNATVALDPSLTQDPCVFHYEGVTVSCQADAGSNSGRPAGYGLVPPEALLLLGARHQEPGPYNVGKCTGVFDIAGNWITEAGLDFLGLHDLAAVGLPERSVMFGAQVRDNFFKCGTRSRSFGDFTVQGKVVSAGKIDVSGGKGKLTAVDPNLGQLPEGAIQSRQWDQAQGCVGDIKPACGAVGTRKGYSGTLAYLEDTPEDSDPGRNDPKLPAQNPTDINAAFQTLPYENLSVQSKAYFLEPNGTLSQIDDVKTCEGADRTVVFKPGWYRSADVLNRFTTSPECKDATLWFAPGAGGDGKLLTGDDQPGAYLLDFRQGSAVACHGDHPMVSRWCLGGDSDQNIRVVVGSPKGWSPYDPNGSGVAPAASSAVSIDKAGTIDNDLSVKWWDESNTKSIDGSFATYTPCTVFGLFNCPSIDRAIRMRDFTPDVISPPVSETDHPRGRLFVDVAYGLENGDGLSPALVIEAVSPESGRKPCGTYSLEPQTYGGSGPIPTTTLTDEQAWQLSAACGTVDLINGLEVKFQATGNFFNFGDPKAYLDGVRIHYDTFSGAGFPYPDPSAEGDQSEKVAARSDCDPQRPGAQLIFTGESNVYVADGSIEVCAGPWSTDSAKAEQHLSIGLYGVPAVVPVTPSNVWLDGGTFAQLSATGPEAAARLRIGEPGGRQDVSVQYGDCTLLGWFGNKKCYDYLEVGYDGKLVPLIGIEGRMKLTMNSYVPPAGFDVKRVDLRISYNTHNSMWGFGVGSATSRLAIEGLKNEIELPRNPSILQYANDNELTIYSSHSPGDGINLQQLESGDLEMIFKARTACLSCGLSSDQLEGLELDITLEPKKADEPMLIPQSGCIVAHPNYESGAGGPDCAMVKADSRQNTETDTFTLPWSPTREGNWVGRVSVKGTIYAPSAAMEIDDADNAYPLATRGVVLRHLRVSGWKYRAGYSRTPISNYVDRTPAPREATFVACTQTTVRIDGGVPCDKLQGDVLLAASRVRFEVADGKAKVPNTVWWTTDVG